jgi:hypothetical protein
VLRCLVEKQRKLTVALLGSLLLVGGLAVSCSTEKYSAFSLAVVGLWSVLIGGHTSQARAEKPEERSGAQPLP